MIGPVISGGQTIELPERVTFDDYTQAVDAKRRAKRVLATVAEQEASGTCPLTILEDNYCLAMQIKEAAARMLCLGVTSRMFLAWFWEGGQP